MPRALACVLALASAIACTAPAAAEEIRSPPNPRVAAALDILRTDIRVEQGWALFSMELRGAPGGGGARPARAARGARPEERKIVAYIWPISIDPSAVGFERGSGSLALAVAAHPDF